MADELTLKLVKKKILIKYKLMKRKCLLPIFDIIHTLASPYNCYFSFQLLSSKARDLIDSSVGNSVNSFVHTGGRLTRYHL
jgi:hypothetical protein